MQGATQWKKCATNSPAVPEIRGCFISNIPKHLDKKKHKFGHLDKEKSKVGEVSENMGGLDLYQVNSYRITIWKRARIGNWWYVQHGWIRSTVCISAVLILEIRPCTRFLYVTLLIISSLQVDSCMGYRVSCRNSRQGDFFGNRPRVQESLTALIQNFLCTHRSIF